VSDSSSLLHHSNDQQVSRAFQEQTQHQGSSCFYSYCIITLLLLNLSFLLLRLHFVVVFKYNLLLPAANDIPAISIMNKHMANGFSEILLYEIISFFILAKEVENKKVSGLLKIAIITIIFVVLLMSFSQSIKYISSDMLNPDELSQVS
jgi:hypothetical protein